MRLRTKKSTGPVCDFDRTVTPMVDVVFQLLVFFVLASGGRIAERTLSTSLSAGAIASTLPQTTTEQRATEVWLHLRRDATDGKIILRVNHGPPGDLGLLPQALAAARQFDPSSNVILDVQGEVAWGDVIRAYDACRQAKIRTINFAASPEDLR